MFLTELKYNVLFHNSLKLLKKSLLVDVLSQFAGFSTVHIEELYIFFICAVDRKEEKTNGIK